MSQELPYILPLSPSEVQEVLGSYQITNQFYREVYHRSEFQRYCQWYYRIAQEHRQDLNKMRGELNILQWFRRR